MKTMTTKQFEAHLQKQNKKDMIAALVQAREALVHLGPSCSPAQKNNYIDACNAIYDLKYRFDQKPVNAVLESFFGASTKMIYEDDFSVETIVSARTAIEMLLLHYVEI